MRLSFRVGDLVTLESRSLIPRCKAAAEAGHLVTPGGGLVLRSQLDHATGDAVPRTARRLRLAVVRSRVHDDRLTDHDVIGVDDADLVDHLVVMPFAVGSDLDAPEIAQV